ncbi:hypothetical protein V5O48_003189 [Marasmius crinis-equi]|uniref:Glucose-methanol-choline oxidoreductase N-terminal domain-containing protein n=1 Tax=Marasmius crinis-equi TaxID=585013 RepID=A0ABR3FTJ9_9AGAR
MNGMAYVRGASSDYDRYARVTGDPGWSWDALQPYFRKNEQWIPPADGHNTTGQFDPRVHGFHGINSVSLYGFSIPDLDSRVTALSEERPDLFHFNLDTNSGSPIGIGIATILTHGAIVSDHDDPGWQQATIKDGKRSSSFTSYLAQQFLVRPNLHVLINAQATRVLSSNNSTVFNLVEFGSKGGPRKVVFTSKEIVISAGTLETPKLLMNSGIGDPEELLSHGTRPVVDLPDVGKNLSVHVGLGMNYFVNSTDTVDDFFRNATFRNELARKWVDADGGGRLGGNYNAHPAWYRLPDDSVIFRDHPDPSSGRNAPHISGSVSNGIHSNVPPEGHFVTLDSALLTPTSRGTIQLSSSDPFDPPLIDPACLTTDFDISAIREGMKHAMAVASASVWDGYILGPLTNLSLSSTDAELEAYARAHAAPNGHIVGTASMSKKGANYGVVDPDLRVKKATGLRVVDASVLPFVPAGNTQAPVYAVAERAADLIKETWK